jgi:putative hydrolase of the HAD superfamily
MKYKAVIFDLFGTLVENLPEPEYKLMLAKMALVISADQGQFVSLWNEYFDDLMTGRQEVDKCIDLVCRKMGLAPADRLLNNAYEVLSDCVRLKLEPPTDTLAAISDLNDNNYITGLISNCSNEVPLLWKSSALSSKIHRPVFSCSVGLTKPDPRIFLLAAERLGVEPQHCLFIDDNLVSLYGATDAGMTAVLIQDERLNSPLIDPIGWNGNIVSSIIELSSRMDILSA